MNKRFLSGLKEGLLPLLIIECCPQGVTASVFGQPPSDCIFPPSGGVSTTDSLLSVTDCTHITESRSDYKQP